jgi:hypothetical protein
MRLPTKLAVVASTAVATIGLASTSWGYFTASATAPGSAQVGTVNPPTGVTAGQTVPGVGTVHVDWTPPAPAGLPLSGYYVERLSGSTATPACDSAPGALLAAGSSDCNDTALVSGSYSYRVTAVFGTWTATSTPAAVDVTVAVPV